MKEPKTGVQLYTLRDHIQTAADFEKTLERLSAMGVDLVQISGIGRDVTPAEQKESLERYGMSVCVTHQSFDRIMNDIDALIELHHIIGCDALGLGCAPAEARGTVENVRAFLEKVQSAAEKLRENGISFHYHNHDFEFHKLEDSGKTMMDVMLEESDPELFHLIPDVAWIHYAGGDPAAFLERYSERVRVVHFKDHSPSGGKGPDFVSLGQGVVPLEECFSVCREKEIPYVVYEQDNGWKDGDPFVSTAESLAYFELLHSKS